MNIWDELFRPWKKWKGIKEDTVAAARGDGNDSVFGPLGAAVMERTDPLAWILGDKYVDFFNKKIPKTVNRALQPVSEFHGKYLDPVRMMAPEDSWVNKDAGPWIDRHNGDLIAAAAAAYFGGSALGSAMGGSGTGGGSGGGSGASGFSWGDLVPEYSNEMWSDPSTYMKLARNMPSGGGESGYDAGKANQEFLAKLLADAEERRKLEEQRRLSKDLEPLIQALRMNG